MTGKIPEEKIQEIRERTDIVELVGSYLPLRRSGANHLGLCPFHGEKTPSFNVNATRQIFHCFGCGVGGNAFSFLMRMEGLTFPEAVRRLGERVGIEVAEEERSPEEDRRLQERERLYRLNETVSRFYEQVLLEAKEGAPARGYLRRRGFGGAEARQFRFGFAPERGSALVDFLRQQGHDLQPARQLGLIRSRDERDYDLFRRRLLIPIVDLTGQVAAFGGRVLDDSLPKYINSAESPVYHKGRVLYGLYHGREKMRQSGEAILVEGYFDQLALVRAGYANAVATCGTALTAEHAQLVKRYAKRVLLLFDQDGAGQKATFRAMEVLLAAGLPASVVTLDAGEDPDSFLRRRGEEEFRRRLEGARPVMEVFIDSVFAACGAGIEGRARAVEEIAAKLALLPSDVERSLYLQALAARTGLDQELLRKMAAAPKAAAQVATPVAAPVAAPPPRPRSAPPRLPEGAALRAQNLLLHMMLLDAGIRARVASESCERFFFDPDRRAIAARILSCASGETLQEAHLYDGLGEEQKAILSGILIKDEKAFAEDAERIFHDCRQAAEREALRRRSRELQQLIRAAEKDGGPLAALQTELLQINRQLKSGV